MVQNGGRSYWKGQKKWLVCFFAIILDPHAQSRDAWTSDPSDNTSYHRIDRTMFLTLHYEFKKNVFINFIEVYDYCMNIPELTEVGLAMSHAISLLSASEAIKLDFTNHPLCLYIKIQNSRDRSFTEKGLGDSNPEALLPLYETLNELGVFQSSILQVNSYSNITTLHNFIFLLHLLS